jgi:hypothetical protein
LLKPPDEELDMRGLQFVYLSAGVLPSEAPAFGQPPLPRQTGLKDEWNLDIAAGREVIL